ncbi:MAG: amidohydrolase family protein [Nitrospiraceae bacterium]
MIKDQCPVIVGVLFALFTASSALAEKRLRVFDTHVHYSQDAWASFSPKAVIKLLDQAGVSRALVSSTPDDGTLMLYQEDAKRIVPILRPYRSPADMGDWFRRAEVLTYVEERLKRNIYRGIGEFHLMDVRHAQTAQIVRLVQEAVKRGLVLHVHSDAEPIRALYAINPEVKILWAHAGMSAPPAVISNLLDRYPKLWTEVSLRANDIAPNGRLATAWQELFLRHPERFMIGTDTWATWRWPDYVELIQEHRAWLGQLPKEVAEKIAYRNATRLFNP